MDPEPDSQATQQATQNAFDPRRIGQQNSGFSDQDISDIICLLYPISEAASHEIQRIASSPEYACHTVGRFTADAIKSDLYHEDDARAFGRAQGIGDHALVLRLSSPLKDPSLGFTFGRNQSRCDICFASDPARRLSNIHCRIYVNSYGCVLLEDQSTNGTVVDAKLLRKRDSAPPDYTNTRRTLHTGSTIKIVMHENKYDLIFLVRIPRREGEYEEAYMKNVAPYLLNLNGTDDVNKTISPALNGHVNMFAPTRRTPLNNQALRIPGAPRPGSNLPREWRGGDKYARVSVIGKGAFATVHKVTARNDGSPYAAKELDKRKFMKNGVLDQKVENEMKIMQRVKHPNIVQYIEHFDWDVNQFIIIMEYVPGGDLGKLIHEQGPIAEQFAKIIAHQLVDALGYLHENKITHRDVKPDNILIQTTHPLIVKLTDFGLSKMIDTEQTFLKTFCGTLLYCAPEVYTEYSSYDDYGRRTNRKSHRPVDRERYDHAVDIWSLGGVLFNTLTGAPPFPVKNGVTYTELLDHIIKTPLDITPLTNWKISNNGIHFLTRMIHVRPETRATIKELTSHPWLGGSGSFDDEELNEALSQSASLLTLKDNHISQTMRTGASSLSEPEPDFSSMDFELEKENDSVRRPHVPKLFGEVSAIGSSGVIPEERLNLSGSNMSFGDTELPEPGAYGSYESASFGETERPESEVRDSYEDSEDFSTPREYIRQTPNNIPAVGGPSQEDNSRSALFGIGSQSLGGASSILKNLNMKSVANIDPGLTSSRISNLATSKRKPNYDTSDEYDTLSANMRHSLKRLKSEGDIDNIKDEDILFASMPQITKLDLDRQIEYPVSKEEYWDARDQNTKHLNYPEMTNLQFEAFQRAAESRKEIFAENKSPLWELAMKYFPPTYSHGKEPARPHGLHPGVSHEEGAIRKSADRGSPQTALLDTLDNQFASQLDIPTSDEHTLPNMPSALVQIQQPKTEVGFFKSSPGSLLPNILIPLRDPILSWGREKGNTVVYELATESRVPKNAFRVVLWREGYKASSDELRPWESARSTTVRTTRTYPEPDAYAFYIATKATKGIRINGRLLQSHDSKDAKSICKHWIKIYHGDYITFWGTGDPNAPQAGFIFECSWGGSSKKRPDGELPSRVSPSLADQLDRIWPRVEKSLLHRRIVEEAQIDHEMRIRDVAREQERSRRFEQRRLQAVHRLEQQASREPSPAKDRLERAGTGPPSAQRLVPASRVPGGR